MTAPDAYKPWQRRALAKPHRARNGLLTGTGLGSLTDSYSYNGFGEVSQYLAKFGTADLYKTNRSRDKLGRITQKIETVGSIANTFGGEKGSEKSREKAEKRGQVTFLPFLNLHRHLTHRPHGDDHHRH